jgi:2,3-bisphosphoglycerate-dependent phosphoglycerate mutase
MRLYIIRHGQSFNNALWAETGAEKGRSFDPVLTDIGQRQAECAAQFLRDDLAKYLLQRGAANEAGRPTRVYTSLMTRAVSTGTIIARALDVPLIALHEAHEIGGLYLEDEITGERTGIAGPNRAHFEEHYPHLTLPETVGERGWWDERANETDEERITRARRVWQDLRARHGETDDIIALITHGGFYDHLLTAMLDTHHPNHFWFPLNNCAISRIEYSKGNLAVMYHNRFDFLPPELIT